MSRKGQSGLSTALAYEGLPPELAEFLSRDTYSLLIKGESGTGKTILALTILRSLHPIENLLYLSTRTSPLQLVENHPWVEDIFGEATNSDEGETKASEGWETLVDARLDEPSVVFERITNVLMDKQAPTVVIDSWESMSDALGGEALRTNIKVLQTWRERAGAKFIFVGEDPSNTAIDFMVEGVVVLKDRPSDGRRLRQITLSKLHGSQISRPSYFFTLAGGVFRSLPSYTPRDYAFRNPAPVKFDKPFRRSKGHFPTGYEALDSFLDGGLPAKSVAVIEVERGLDARVGLIFVSRMVQDWLAAGDNVVLQRPGEIESRFIQQYSKCFGGGMRNKIAVVGHRYRVGDERAWTDRSKSRTGKTLYVLARPSETGDAGRAPTPPRAELTVYVGRKDILGSDLLNEAETHIRLIQLEGTLFVECLLPWSTLLAVVPGSTSGNPMIQLELVV